jgi:hypothetical protein
MAHEALAEDHGPDREAERAKDLIRRHVGPQPSSSDATSATSPSHDPGGLGVPGDGDRPGIVRVVGWALADHMRSELIDDAFPMRSSPADPTRA